MRKTAIRIALVALVTVGAACSSETSSPTASSPGSGTIAPSTSASDVCTDLDATQQAVDDLRNVDLAAEGADGLTSALDDVKSSLRSLESSASTELSAQIAAVESAVQALENTISSAGDGVTLTDIATELTALGTSVSALVADVGECS